MLFTFDNVSGGFIRRKVGLDNIWRLECTGEMEDKLQDLNSGVLELSAT